MSECTLIDNGSSADRRYARAGSKTNVVKSVAAGLFLSLAATGAVAQNQAPADFRVTVVDLSARSQQVTVPLYGSTLIETSVEVIRADVIESRIADVQVLSPTRLLLSGQGFGQTNIILTGPNDQEHLLEVSVELDLRRLNRAIAEIDPLANAQARSILGNIVLSGSASSAERANRMVEIANLFLPPTASSGVQATIQNHLELAGEQQVLLRCIVAEVTRSSIRELGINGFMAGDNFHDVFLVNQLGGINPINIGAAGNALVDGTIPFVTDASGIPLGSAATLSLGFPRGQVQLFIKALADNNLLQILAEPNLVAISGETATFLAGGEFPVPIPQQNGTPAVSYREYGVRLTFTPTVRDHQRIRLKVSPEVSERDDTVGISIGGLLVPGKLIRSTSTTVELGNGETIAISGLLNEFTSAVASRIPGLGDLPILGPLFRSVRYQRNLTELVILVTPEIVAPLDAHQVDAIKSYGRQAPTDRELYFGGRIETEQRADVGSFQVQDGVQDSNPNEISLHGPWGHAAPVDNR